MIIARTLVIIPATGVATAEATPIGLDLNIRKKTVLCVPDKGFQLHQSNSNCFQYTVYLIRPLNWFIIVCTLANDFSRWIVCFVNTSSLGLGFWMKQNLLSDLLRSLS